MNIDIDLFKSSGLQDKNHKFKLTCDDVNIDFDNVTYTKIGKDGFIEFAPFPVRVVNDEVYTKKVNGLVKLYIQSSEEINIKRMNDFGLDLYLDEFGEQQIVPYEL